MRSGWALLGVLALVLTACSPHRSPSTASLADRSDAELAVFLPTLTDYLADGRESWNVQQRVGPQPARSGQSSPVGEPAGCSDPPYDQKKNVAAEATGRTTNLGPTGFGGEASVRILRDPSGDLTDAARAWAKRCHDYRVTYPGAESASPTAVSVLPATRVDGVDVLRIHLTDNRDHRFQPEGTRESVVSLARVRGVVVYGYAHDVDDRTDELVTATIRRLLSGMASSKPVSGKPGTDSLIGRSDGELAQLLPTVADMPEGWLLGQTAPVLGARSLDYQSDGVTYPRGCDAPPFMNHQAPRADIGRDFREVATVTTAKQRNDLYALGSFDGPVDTDDTVRLNIERPAVDVISETRFWARQCTSYAEVDSGASSARKIRGTVELLPGAPPDPNADETVSVHVKRTGPRDFDFTASALRVRGVLMVTLPALGQNRSPLLQQTLDNLRTASFGATTPSASPPRPPFDAPPPGAVALPRPTPEATDQLSRVAEGTLVNPEQYHLGGYMPGDGKTRSPEALYFRSPTGSISCAYQQKWAGRLICDVPEGTYRRTPKPATGTGTWFDHYVKLDSDSLENGMWAENPRVYAETSVLPYGSTIRLHGLGPGGDTECLMARDGLTCVNYDTRVGMHLSRDDLTPLVGTDTLRSDTRPEPG